MCSVSTQATPQSAVLSRAISGNSGENSPMIGGYSNDLKNNYSTSLFEFQGIMDCIVVNNYNYD